MNGVDELIGKVNNSLSQPDADKAWRFGSKTAEEFGILNSRIGENLRSLAVRKNRD